ncbi:hypothetical protein ACFPZN_17225 [Actinomadura rugatobispora]|uniref:Uncharacterized protein n=2 Tax=Actinomadura rugatobispora TaxID=1994 RepID=A0ABW0ZXX7_9ACTN
MTSQQRLAALGAHLVARGLTIGLTEKGLRVTNPHAGGCCDDAAHPADTITCHARREDDGRMWFWTSWGEPITDASKVILGNLAGGGGR